MTLVNKTLGVLGFFIGFKNKNILQKGSINRFSRNANVV